MRRLLAMLSCASLLAAPAAASIPPVGWEGSRWTGPGLLCRPSFTLALQEGERAEQQYPSVGLIRFVVRSDEGVFEVAEDWMSGRIYEERELVRETPLGNVFKLTDRSSERTYLYVPRDSELPFLLRFDPLTSEPPSFTGDGAERDVMERVSFAKANRQGCLDQEVDETQAETGR